MPPNDHGADRPGRNGQSETVRRPLTKRQLDRPIYGPYREFGAEVRRLLGATPGASRPYLSLKAAERRTGVSGSTIALMAHGEKVRETSIVQFAAGLGEDPRRLLNLAGRLTPDDVSAAVTGPVCRDPLLAAGDEVALSALDAPLSDAYASAGEPLTTAAIESARQPLSEFLPGGIRAIRVRGGCMEPLFRDGDVLLVRPASTAHTGDAVVARVGSETVSCKVFQHTDAGDLLTAEGGDGPHVRISADFEILGVVEGYIRLKGRGAWPS